MTISFRTMRSVRLHRIIGALVIVCLAGIGTSVFAQPGKIRAKVVDAKTGEGLLRASVQVLETKQGAYTKDNGIATIINISPGENYTVVAKYAGYEPQTVKGVRIKSDATTELSFRLSTKAQDTILVSAEKLVDKSVTNVGTKLSSTEITSTAGRHSVDQVVALTPGLVRDNSNGGFSIHGARGTQNSIRFNNIETNDVVNGATSVIQSAVSPLAISEVNVTTAGGDASKGGYIGGEINTQTKGGGLDFEMTAHYRQEIPALFGSSDNGYKQMGSGDRIYELAMGGPLFTSDVRYFLTAKINTRDYLNAFTTPTQDNEGLNVVDPYGNTTGQLPNSKYYSRAATAKVTFDVLGFHLSADAVLSAVSRQTNGVTLAYGDPAELPARNTIDNLYTLRGNKALGENGSDGLVEFTVGYERVNDRYGKYDQSAGGGLLSLYKLYDPQDNFSYDDNNHVVTPGPDGIIDIYTPVSKQIPDPRNPANILSLSSAGLNPFTGHIEGAPISYSTANPYGLLNQYIVAGNVGGFFHNTRDQIQLEGKYTNQIGTNHLVNAGFEGHLYTLFNYNNGLPWDANPFSDSFVVKPFIGAIYVGDKMEFNDITFNPSLRFDIYNPGNDHALVDPNHPIDSATKQPNFTTAPVQTQLSPRLGITYAVTEQTIFNFNYGLYFEQPLFGEVLTNTGGNFNRVIQRGNQIIGNGSLKAQHTQEFTVGFTTALTDVLSMSLQGIYKDLRNLSGLSKISSSDLAIGYTLYSDDQYGNYRGIELTFEKRMSDNYSFRFNYTYSVSKGTSSSAAENYGLLINSGATGEDPNVVLPLQPFALSFDRTHVAELLLTAGFNRGEGPTIFGTKLLQLLSLSTTTEYQSGVPYTRLNAKGQQSGEFNGDREPAYFQTDAQLTRNIPLADLFGESFGNTSLDLQLEVVNLFNTTNPLFVYPTSGQGDDDGVNPLYTGTTDFINDPTNADGQQIDALGKLKYNPRWDLNHDGRVSIDEQSQAYQALRKTNFARRTNYQIPRRVYFNVTLHF